MRTDYLIVGAGATGLAFTDTLVHEADVKVVIVDRRNAPGGHWRDAYPFVRLHSPSAYYGVNSQRLGLDRLDETGENAGLYERATGTEVRAYFAEVAERLVADGRVRVLYRQEHLGSGPDGELVRDLATGTVHTVHVSRRVVDARYQEPSIPATHTPSFEVADEAWVVPVNQLPTYAEGANRFTVLGSGKTAVDACLWLLEQRVDPDRIRWVRPRDAWFHDRSAFQPLELVAWTMEGISYDAEAAALASDTADLFDRLESSGRLFRIDPSRPAKMYRGTMLSTHELNLLRQIGDVVRLGAATRVTESRIHLQDGEVAASRGDLHVDCTARGLGDAPDVPIFGQQIVLQQVRHNSPTFNAAMIGFVEARRDSDTEKNRLCPPNRYASSVRDWAPMMRRTWRTEGDWLGEPDLAAWVADSRLNLLRGLADHASEPRMQAALERYLKYVGAAVERAVPQEPIP
ncbi:MAG: NAD(P)-binding protein [Jiangellaceae bacterium]